MSITELRIEGLRTLEKIRLKLGGLTVLIGDNGSGKSSIIEACELLHRAASERFLDEFYSVHGGLTSLLRQGAPRLKLGVTIKPDPDSFSNQGAEDWSKFDLVEYDILLTPEGGAFASVEETVRVYPRKGSDWAKAWSRKKRPPKTVDSILLLHRTGSQYTTAGLGVFLEGEIAFNVLSPNQVNLYRDSADCYTALKIIASHLRHIRVHLPFEVLPSWAARALDRKSALRASIPFAPAKHLEKLGVNLANSFHALKNNFGQDEWNQTLEYVRLGLGSHIEDVTTWADPGGGNVGLSLKLKNLDQQIPSSQLSDGMLSYLAFVALFRLHDGVPGLMALDEPDLHLHPRLLMRVLDMFESMARRFPVLVSTHSDRLLDGLSEPARSVVLCELDDRQATHLLRPNPRLLAKWLERYRGLGDIRGEGHEASVFTREDPA
ncbi:AAA family ATPase [Cystobacter fuscus]|uniref:AAA family ATPase n=1 Tax=Cystobacter fuscus TaxID=43 RepID=UPI002B2B09E3|nr:AAA family ATPase [Cystobacter fuscus]